MCGQVQRHEEWYGSATGNDYSARVEESMKKREIAEKLNTACLMMRSKQIHQPVYTGVFNLCFVVNGEKGNLTGVHM
jgi:hypothetical protein